MISIERFVELAHQRKISPQIIYDVGSLDGKDALALRDAFPGSKAYGFEACPRNWAENAPCIEGWFNVTLLDEPQPVTFYQLWPGCGAGSVRHQDFLPHKPKEQIKTAAVRLDDFAAAYTLPPPDMVKVDVEGCALEVLIGFGALLDTVRILHVETETEEMFHGQAFTQDVYSFLWEQGFQLVEHSYCQHSQWDGVWVR